jgi:hypothetical protein
MHSRNATPIRALLVAVAFAGFVAPLAHADSSTDDQFMSELNQRGIVIDDGGSANVGQLAQLMCAKRASGMSQSDMINIVMRQVTYSQASDFVHLAMLNYCPQYLSNAGTTSEPLTMTAPPSTRSPQQANLPGTDAQGFVGYPAARCDPGSTPAVMGRTTQSVFVVCETGPASYYYRGLRLSDGASIELANAVRSSDGFDVTNPVDGTRYQVRPTSISITSPGGQVSTEPMA